MSQQQQQQSSQKPSSELDPASAARSRSERARQNMRRHQGGPGGPGGKAPRENKYRNVHIAQKDQAIWEYFRARTQPGTQIFIGKNTIIGPGVQLFADKGTIKIGDNNIVGEGTIIINKSKEDLIIGNGNVFECNSS